MPDIELVQLIDGRTVQRFGNSRFALGRPRLMDDDATAIVPAGNGSMRAFDLETGGLKWVLSGHSSMIDDTRLAPGKNLLASTRYDGTVRIWDLAQKKEISKFQIIKPKGFQTVEVRWNPMGDRIATFSFAWMDSHASEHSARVWSARTGEALFDIPLHMGIHDLAWNPDGTLLAMAHQGGYARLWDATDGSLLVPPLSRPEWATAVAFDPSGERLATGGYQENSSKPIIKEVMIPTIRVWNVASGPRIISISPEGRQVAVKEDWIIVKVSAWHADGIIGFQLEKNGEVQPLGSESIFEADKKGGAAMTWIIERPEKEETHLRIRAMERTGVLSRPQLMTVQWR